MFLAPFRREDSLLSGIYNFEDGSAPSLPRPSSPSRLPRLILPAAFKDVKKVAACNEARDVPAVGYGDHAPAFRRLSAADPKLRNELLIQYFRNELDHSRLNCIHKHLWLAGQERPSRALHHQALIGRRVVVTEDPNLHLLWIDDKVFVKPLPEFLLCFDVWENHLVKSVELYENAVGMLLSYIWLVRHRSDLRIAHAEGLLPVDLISWEQWTTLCDVFLSRIDYEGRTHMNPRYRYGDLRLHRINWIWRFCSQSSNMAAFVRGYFVAYHDHSTFFSRNIAWIASAMVYFVLMLTAMQVGLGTRLQNSQTFQNVTFGFVVFAIVIAPAAVFLRLVVIIIFVLNLLSAVRLRERQRSWRQRAVENSAGLPYSH